jgi:hypothetical protein
VHGRVAEWFKAPVLKTGRGLSSLVSSNLTPSANTVFQAVSSRLNLYQRTLYLCAFP